MNRSPATRPRPRAAPLVGLALLLAGASTGPGCRGHRERAEPATAAAPDLVGQHHAGDEVVAEVDGQPIFASCVATQMAATGAEAHAALDQCIDFELLARAAEKRGYADRPEVREARKVETVRAVIDKEFVANFSSPEDIPEADLRQYWNAWKDRFDHPEIRLVQYVRVEVDEKLPRGGPEDVAAHDSAERIYRALKDRAPLTAGELADTAREIAGDQKLSMSKQPYAMPRHGVAVEEFAAAGFAIPAVGQLSPPTRTQWGWDLLLLTKIIPAEHKTFEQAKPELRQRIFGFSRAQAFHEWTNRLLGGRPDIDVDWLRRLTRAEQQNSKLFESESPP